VEDIELNGVEPVREVAGRRREAGQAGPVTDKREAAEGSHSRDSQTNK